MKTHKPTPRIEKIIAKHGEKLCLDAYRLNRIDGEGGKTIAEYLSVPYGDTFAMIEAGELLIRAAIK